MKALVYQGPGIISWEEVPKPELTGDTDAIVRVDATTICGTDLHILKGDLPAVTAGRILGHEAVGTVESVGSGVKNLKAGDRVLVSCVSACGACRFCREGRFGQCLGGGGWILGYLIDGTQADYVRVPFADDSTYPVPDGVSDEALLMLADILPTGYEVGVLNGGIRPGDVVAVVGAGPIGLSAIMGSSLFSPSHIVAIDLADSRLDAAKQFGADIVVNNGSEDPIAVLKALTDGLGADVAIEAVGLPATFELATKLVRPGGRVANIGVHGKPVTLHLEELWSRDVTITTGLVDTSSTPTLLKLLRSNQLDATKFVTHHFSFDEFVTAYDTFARAAETGSLKVIVTNRSVDHPMSSNVVAELLHLAHGVAPAERDEVVAGLARLDDHIRSYPAGTVRLQLSIKERDTASQRTTLEAWVPRHPPIVATSSRHDFPAAIAEVRDEMVRQLTDLKERTQARAHGTHS